MFSMDLWISLVCGAIVWGAVLSAGKLTVQAVKTTKGKRK